MSLTPEDFESRGYKRFKSGHVSNSDFGLQKTVRSECGRYKKYFLTVYVYDWRKFKSSQHFVGSDFGFSPDVVLFRESDNEQGFISFTVTLNDFDSVSELEDYYEGVYTALQCIPDCHNND